MISKITLGMKKYHMTEKLIDFLSLKLQVNLRGQLE